jgi:hypothetical protein
LVDRPGRQPTMKWRDEMAETFGLDFTIIDSERCAQVRRDYGSAANPFNVYPLSIISLPWLRGAKAQRLLDEVLPVDGPTQAAEGLELALETGLLAIYEGTQDEVRRYRVPELFRRGLGMTRRGQA